MGVFQNQRIKCDIGGWGGQNSKLERDNDILFTSFEGH